MQMHYRSTMIITLLLSTSGTCSAKMSHACKRLSHSTATLQLIETMHLSGSIQLISSSVCLREQRVTLGAPSLSHELHMNLIAQDNGKREGKSSFAVPAYRQLVTLDLR